jgi:hypothetical protein
MVVAARAGARRVGALLAAAAGARSQRTKRPRMTRWVLAWAPGWAGWGGWRGHPCGGRARALRRAAADGLLAARGHRPPARQRGLASARFQVRFACHDFRCWIRVRWLVLGRCRGLGPGRRRRLGLGRCSGLLPGRGTGVPAGRRCANGTAGQVLEPRKCGERHRRPSLARLASGSRHWPQHRPERWRRRAGALGARTRRGPGRPRSRSPGSACSCRSR